MHTIINRLQAIFGLLHFEYVDDDTLQFRLGDDLFEVYEDGSVKQLNYDRRLYPLGNPEDTDKAEDIRYQLAMHGVTKADA